MTKVNFYDSIDDSMLKFAVIIAKHNGKWVFCKHRERSTWEVLGGHREQSLLDRYDSGMVCTNFCKALKPKEGYSLFIYYYWQYMYGKGVFFSYENGTTGIKNLDFSGFIETETILIPPVDKIIAFDNYCNSIFSQIFANGKQNEHLAVLRDTLLPKLMSGELDVSNIDL